MPARFPSSAALAVALFLCACPRAAHAVGDLNATATANALGQIVIDWQWFEYMQPVVTRPDWVGYDLYRRDVAACGPWTLVNAEIIPRVPGATHGGTYVDTPPAPNVTWEYELVPVDAARERIVFVWPEGCESPCAPHMWESVPTLGAPVLVGRVGDDLGWAIVLHACPDGCWTSMYVEGPGVDLLRPYVGSAQAFAFYGTESFGTVEGTALQLDHFESAPCGPTPAARPTWGRVKTLYR